MPRPIIAFPDRFTVIRTEGEYVGGRWVCCETKEICACGSVQPLSDRDIERLPEGIRSSSQFQVYTDFEMRVEKTDTYGPDEVEYRGLRYGVQGVEDWQHLGGYSRYVLTKVAQS